MKRSELKYPLYVISKGRSDCCKTCRELDRIHVPYTLVVEPQEYDAYCKHFDKEKIVTTPFQNLGQGSIPARNFVFDLAIKTGAKRHWILDDNIKEFYRFNRRKILVEDGTIFRCAEDFVDRYDNVDMAGFNYSFFMMKESGKPPFILNTRIYSCILLANSTPFRWRGKYNEDTDLSLRILKSGKCTILFNAFLADKTATMTMKGGNSDELYKGDGRLNMAQSLTEQHPDVCKDGIRYGRYQHVVDYSPFKSNKLHRIVDPPKGVDNYGMKLKYFGVTKDA